MHAQTGEETKGLTKRVCIREGNLDFDRDLLIKAFYQHLTPLSDDRRFDWLYRENPDGLDRVWVAYAPDGKTVIGSGSAIPREIYVAGKEILGCILADFWIDPKYRTLGPALQLQRACMASVAPNTYAFCVDFPQPAMVAIYRRLGILPNTSLVRWAKPLRLDERIRQKVRLPFVSECLSAAGNLVLELRDWRIRRSKDCTVAAHEGEFGDEFTQLSRKVSRSYGSCVARTSPYLNWRYRAHFHHQYSILTARRGQNLLAYVVYVVDQGLGQIVDLFGVPEPDVLASLMAEAAVILRHTGVPLLSTPIVGPAFLTEALSQCGFYSREGSPVITYAPPEVLVANPALNECNWLLMQGDRES